MGMGEKYFTIVCIYKFENHMGFTLAQSITSHVLFYRNNASLHNRPGRNVQHGWGKGWFQLNPYPPLDRYTVAPVMLIFETQKMLLVHQRISLSADSSASNVPTFHTNRHPEVSTIIQKSLVRYYIPATFRDYAFQLAIYVPHPSVKIPGIHHLSTCKIKQASSFFFHVFYPLPLSP